MYKFTYYLWYILSYFASLKFLLDPSIMGREDGNTVQNLDGKSFVTEKAANV